MDGAIVLPCGELAPTLAFFTDRLGLRLDAIWPADDPRVALVSGHGLRLRLDSDASGDPGVLVFEDAPEDLPETAPNGTRLLQERPAEAPFVPELVIARPQDTAAWVTGRAGMDYRDLIPGRQGGRFIASHIRIPDAGPVPDFVHHHAVRFQWIHCIGGRVRVVYEDQGPPFWLEAGDGVLQPPGIRHRVLESGGDLEVIEVGTPALHRTLVDHDLELPTTRVDRERAFAGQRFVHHRGSETSFLPGPEGFEVARSEAREATDGYAEVSEVRALATGARLVEGHRSELLFRYVLAGTLVLEEGGTRTSLPSGTALTVPADLDFTLVAGVEGTRWLEIRAGYSMPVS